MATLEQQRIDEERKKRREIADEAIKRQQERDQALINNLSLLSISKSLGRFSGILGDPSQSPGFIGSPVEREEALKELAESGKLDYDYNENPLDAIPTGMSVDESGNIVGRMDALTGTNANNYITHVRLNNDGNYVPADAPSMVGNLASDKRIFAVDELSMEQRIKANEDIMSGSQGIFTETADYRGPFFEERTRISNILASPDPAKARDVTVIDDRARIDPAQLVADVEKIKAEPFSADQQARLRDAERKLAQDAGVSLDQINFIDRTKQKGTVVPNVQRPVRGMFESSGDFEKRMSDYRREFASSGGSTASPINPSVIADLYDLEKPTKSISDAAGEGLLSDGVLPLLQTIFVMQGLLDNKPMAAPSITAPRGITRTPIPIDDPYKRRF